MRWRLIHSLLCCNFGAQVLNWIMLEVKASLYDAAAVRILLSKQVMTTHLWDSWAHQSVSCSFEIFETRWQLWILCCRFTIAHDMTTLLILFSHLNLGFIVQVTAKFLCCLTRLSDSSIFIRIHSAPHCFRGVLVCLQWLWLAA